MGAVARTGTRIVARIFAETGAGTKDTAVAVNMTTAMSILVAVITVVTAAAPQP